MAVDMALELGMNRQEFSVNNGEGCNVLEESWRRTWWELYVIDGLLAAIHQRNTFRLYNIPTDVPLPCEEVDYFITGVSKHWALAGSISGRLILRGVGQDIPSPVQLMDIDDSAFSSEERVFSSFSYRVEAIRNVGKILAVGQRGVSEESDVDEADACLVNWALHLPESKRSLVDRDGQVDEMLFQAYMIANAYVLRKTPPPFPSSAPTNGSPGIGALYSSIGPALIWPSRNTLMTHPAVLRDISRFPPRQMSSTLQRQLAPQTTLQDSLPSRRRS
jgi:hypothetical protein